MNKYLIGSVAAVSLVLGACGGGSTSGGGNDGPQGKLADMMIEAAKATSTAAGDAGISIDEKCLRDAVAKLSDKDAQALLDAGPDDQPELSAEADAIGNQVAIDCISLGG